jgi:hypothetical protein
MCLSIVSMGYVEFAPIPWARSRSPPLGSPRTEYFPVTLVSRPSGRVRVIWLVVQVRAGNRQAQTPKRDRPWKAYPVLRAVCSLYTANSTDHE